MISAFAPLLPARAARAPCRARTRPTVRTRAHDPRPVAWCVLLFALLLEAATTFFPEALRLDPLQATPAFKKVSGYALLALMAFTMAFGVLRRAPAMALHLRRLNELHQLAGLLILVLLALHMVQQPAGFLWATFHVLASGVACGALRALVGTRMGRGASTVLLAGHIGASCLVAAAALLHLWFVYAYTA